ncbi:MAG: CGNR zinc finger domain-containing protein [Candidatus Dormibacteria bacterium]
MKFESYQDRGVASAVELVNRLSPSWARGRSFELPHALAARRRLAEEVEGRLSPGRVTLKGQGGEELIRLAQELRLVFELISLERRDRAAALVNSLLSRYQAAPQLARHDGESWHLHFHSQDKEAGRVVARGAMCAIALAVVIGSPGEGRLGVCEAEHCQQVFVDTSKNGSRRFCSSTCLSRTKVAAFRARRAALDRHLPQPVAAAVAAAPHLRLRRRPPGR